MRLKLAFASAALCALGAFCGPGCDAGGDGGSARDVVGTWVRTRVHPMGAESGFDTWTLTFREDGTFTLVHVHEETNYYTPETTTTARDGEYTVGSDGKISLSGGWAQNLGEVNTLDELAAVYWTFTEDTMCLVGESGETLFMGPDFNIDSVYVAGDSYNLLFLDDQNAYRRESSLVLTDGSGAVVEQRIESYAYTLIDDTSCAVAYSFSNLLNDVPSEGSGTVTECEYFFETDKPVDTIDGAGATVSVIRFEYDLDGVGKVDNFALPDELGGDVLISYQPSMQTRVLIDSAYVKTSN